MNDWIFKFVVGADSELGGNKLRLMALTNDKRILQIDYSSELMMPSSFAYDQSRNLLYVTDELNGAAGKLAVYSIDEGNKMRVLQIIQTKGSNPCHVAVDETRKLLYVAHYSGGGVICYNLLKNGLIDENPNFVMKKNKSFHCVLPSKDGFIALDSIDDELIHACYSSELPDYSTTIVKVPSPRQAKYCDLKRILIVSENESMIYTYNVETKEIIKGKNTCIEKTNINKASSIWVSKNYRTMIVSNRGEDSLIVFDIAKSDNDTLNNPRALLIGGYKCPRDFDVSYDEEYAVVGFTESNCVEVYRINRHTNRADFIASQKVIAPIGIHIL